MNKWSFEKFILDLIFLTLGCSSLAFGITSIFTAKWTYNWWRDGCFNRAFRTYRSALYNCVLYCFSEYPCELSDIYWKSGRA